METEFKWNLEAGFDAEAMLDDELFRNLMLDEEPEKIEMETTYYDTVKGHLLENSASLRSRRENEKIVWTLKIGAMAKNGLHQRQEWEMEMTEEIEESFGDVLFNHEVFLDEADGDGDPDGQLRGLVESIATHELKEIGFLRFTRHRFDAGYGASLLEISVDDGEIVKDDKKVPVKELEIELKEGSVQDLLDLVELIQERYHFVPEQRSKLVRCLEQ